MKHFVKFLLFLALASGCDSEETLSLDTGAAYFPLENGIFHVYDVEEVRYSSSGDPVVLYYELMTQVVYSFPSSNGNDTYVIQRSTRAQEDTPWEPLDTWSVRKENGGVVIAEGNTPFVKVKFPIRADVRWDGNALNSLGKDEYQLKGIHEPMVLDGITFEKTITVEQEKNEDPIVFRDERSEVYARDVGLIYRKLVQLSFCTDDHCLGQQKIDHGTELKMVIKQYGKY